MSSQAWLCRERRLSGGFAFRASREEPPSAPGGAPERAGRSPPAGGRPPAVVALHRLVFRAFEVGGYGNPVRIRSGPATVTGEASRRRATGEDDSPGRHGW